MTRVRSLPKDATLVMPTDFLHDDVSVRWRVLDTDDAVIKSGQDLVDHANASDLRTFQNIWDIQETTQNPNNASEFYGAFVKRDEYALTGSVNAAVLEWAAGGSFGGSEIATRGFDIQWSIKENPSLDISNTADWNSAQDDVTVLQSVLLDPSHKSLWVRIIPTDQTVQTFSNISDNGNGTEVEAIKVDTSTMRYAVSVDQSVIETIATSGTTQNLNAVEDPYLSSPWTGITMENVDSSGQSTSVPDAEKPLWIQNVGITLQYKVTATRTKDNLYSWTRIWIWFYITS